MFIPLLDGIPAVRSRRGPRRRRPGKLHADKAYDAADLRAYCRRLGITPRTARRATARRPLCPRLGITPRVARRGIERNDRLGRHRWRIERTISWLFGYRRLT